MARLFAGHPEAMREALDELDEQLDEAVSNVSVSAAEREAAWTEQARW